MFFIYILIVYTSSQNGSLEVKLLWTERSSGRNYSQAAIAVLVITTSSALTAMCTILTHPFLLHKSSKLFGRALLPLPSTGITGQITGGTVPRSVWEMLKTPNSTGIQENLKDSPTTTSIPWVSTTARPKLRNWGLSSSSILGTSWKGEIQKVRKLHTYICTGDNILMSMFQLRNVGI